MRNTNKKDTFEFNIPIWLIVIIIVTIIAVILFLGGKSFGDIFLRAFPRAFLEVFIQILIVTLIIGIIKKVFFNSKKAKVKEKSIEKKLNDANKENDINMSFDSLLMNPVIARKDVSDKREIKTYIKELISNTKIVRTVLSNEMNDFAKNGCLELFFEQYLPKLKFNEETLADWIIDKIYSDLILLSFLDKEDILRFINRLKEYSINHFESNSKISKKFNIDLDDEKSKDIMYFDQIEDRNDRVLFTYNIFADNIIFAESFVLDLITSNWKDIDDYSVYPILLVQYFLKNIGIINNINLAIKQCPIGIREVEPDKGALKIIDELRQFEGQETYHLECIKNKKTYATITLDFLPDNEDELKNDAKHLSNCNIQFFIESGLKELYLLIKSDIVSTFGSENNSQQAISISKMLHDQTKLNHDCWCFENNDIPYLITLYSMDRGYKYIAFSVSQLFENGIEN